MEILVIVIRRPTIFGAFHADVFSIQATKAVEEIPLCFKATSNLLPFLSCLWNSEILSSQTLPNCMASLSYNLWYSCSSNSKWKRKWLPSLPCSQISQTKTKPFTGRYWHSWTAVLLCYEWGNPFKITNAQIARETFSNIYERRTIIKITKCKQTGIMQQWGRFVSSYKHELYKSFSYNFKFAINVFEVYENKYSSSENLIRLKRNQW